MVICCLENLFFLQALFSKISFSLKRFGLSLLLKKVCSLYLGIQGFISKFLVVLVFQNRKLFSISLSARISSSLTLLSLVWWPYCFSHFLRVFLTSLKLFLSWPFGQFVEIFCCYLGQFLQVVVFLVQVSFIFEIITCKIERFLVLIYWSLTFSSTLVTSKSCFVSLKEKSQKALLLFFFFQVFGLWFRLLYCWKVDYDLLQFVLLVLKIYLCSNFLFSSVFVSTKYCILHLLIKGV